MTSVPATDRAQALADVGRRLSTVLGWVFFAIGWQAAKLVRVAATAIASALFTAGWLAGRTWVGCRWAWAAVCLGWESGRQPIGGRRGPA